MSNPTVFSNARSFTTHGWLICVWILITPFQYGYHISALNQIQAVLTCRSEANPTLMLSMLPACIPMSELTFSVITAIFTIGGLAGSLLANLVMDRWGRKGATTISALLTSVGTGLMGISTSVGVLGFGRFVIGLGSGVGICLAPVFLSEIAPSSISGNVGILTQLGIVLGIMLTQVMGLQFATPTEWRAVLFLSFALSAVQALLGSIASESPVWLGNNGQHDKKKEVHNKLWLAETSSTSTSSDSDPLLDELEARREDAQIVAITVPKLFLARELRKPLVIVCLAMASQQFSGINAVLYYSNAILSKALPDLGPYVSLGITVVNVLMTFPPIVLIEVTPPSCLLLLHVTDLKQLCSALVDGVFSPSPLWVL
ncbi:hypothetical protein H2248_009670 [Termitomyces sp. 'cryptogamus']|nr:hypothetical protein H2248_009670 [Termitomyces sp. 'cryptogamus']